MDIYQIYNKTTNAIFYTERRYRYQLKINYRIKKNYKNLITKKNPNIIILCPYNIIIRNIEQPIYFRKHVFKENIRITNNNTKNNTIRNKTYYYN